MVGCRRRREDVHSGSPAGRASTPYSREFPPPRDRGRETVRRADAARPAGPSALMTKGPSPPAPDEPIALETTAVLLEHARRGDEFARERLFSRFLPVLRGWAHRRLPGHARDLAETDDLVQITLARALARIDAFESRGEGAFLAYLRQILLNAVREEVRRSARRGTRREIDDDVDAAAVATPLEQVLGREAIDRYEAALATLNEDQQQAVVLRLEFGYPYQQVAEALGRPNADAARMLVVRALARLASALSDD